MSSGASAGVEDAGVSPLIDRPLRQLYESLSSALPPSPSSTASLAAALEAYKPYLSKPHDPFPGPSPASDSKLSSSTVTLPDGSSISIASDEERDLARRLSKRCELDQVESLILVRRYTRSEALQPAVRGADDLLDALNVFYFTECLHVPRILSALFRIADDPDHPLAPLAISTLDLILPPSPSASIAPSATLLDAITRRASQPLPAHVRSNAALTPLWAKHQVREQAALLEVLFLAFYTRVPCTGKTVINVLEVARDTNLGAKQENEPVLRADDEGRELIADVGRLLTLLVVAVFNLEQAQAGIDLTIPTDESSSPLFASPALILHAHTLLSSLAVPSDDQPRWTPILLAWAYLLSRLTDVLSALPTPPPTFSSLLPVLLPPPPTRTAAPPQPTYQLLISRVLQPQLRLFPTLSSTLTSTLLRADPNSIAFRSVLKGLLDALLDLVHPSFVPDFPSLLDAFVRLFGTGPADAAAPLAEQYWAQVESDEGRSAAILDVVRQRWPADFTGLVRLLRALTGTGDGVTPALDPTSPSADEPSHPSARASSERVFTLLLALPTYTAILPSGTPVDVRSEQAASDAPPSLAQYTRNPTRLAGLSSPLAAGTRGRVLSPPGQEPAVVCWETGEGVQGWKVLVGVLDDWVRGKSRAAGRKRPQAVSADPFGPTALADPVPLFPEGTEQEEERAVAETLRLIAAVLEGNPDMAPLLVEHLQSRDDGEIAVDGEEDALDLVTILFAIIERSLQRLASSAHAHAPTAKPPVLPTIVASALAILTALLPSFPGRVWTYLRGASALFGDSPGPSHTTSIRHAAAPSTSPILLVERQAGQYPMLLALLDLLLALLRDAQQRTFAERPDFLRLKADVLLRVSAWAMSEVWTEHAGWRYTNVRDKLDVGLRLSTLWTEIVRDPSLAASPQFGTLAAFVADRLASGATTFTLAPLVSTIATGGDLALRLARARRLIDAHRAEALLERDLQLARELLALHRRTGHGKPSLLEHLFFDRANAAHGGKPGREATTTPLGDSKPIELVDVLASYVVSANVSPQISLEAARLLTSLCGLTAVSGASSTPASLAGFFADPHATAAGMIAVVSSPYQDNDLRRAVWDFCSVVVDTQPGLATLLLTGQSVGTAVKEIIRKREKGKAKEGEGAGPELKKAEEEPALKRTVLDVLQENVTIWRELWDSSPTLLQAVLRFLDVVWQHLDDHASTLSDLRKNQSFWDSIVGLALRPTGDAPSPIQSGQDELSMLEEPEDEAGSARHDAPEDPAADVIEYANRVMSKAFAAQVLALELAFVSRPQPSGGDPPLASKSPCIEPLLALAQSQDRLTETVKDVLVCSCDTELHASAHSEITLGFPGFQLEALHTSAAPPQASSLAILFETNREFGPNYVFPTDLVRRKLEGYLANEGIDDFLVSITTRVIVSVNLDWSIVDAQICQTRAYRRMLERLLPLATANTDSVRAAALGTAAAVAEDIVGEERSGEIMTAVHAERLYVLLHLLEATVPRSTAGAPQPPATEPIVRLLDHVQRLMASSNFSVLQSLQRRLRSCFHQPLLHIVFLSARLARSLKPEPKQQHAISSSVGTSLAHVILVMADTLERARTTGPDVELDLDLELLVAVFQQLVRVPHGPVPSYWLAQAEAATLIQLSLEVLVRMPPVRAPAEGIIIEQPAARPAYAQAILDFHLVLASVPQAAERLALEGVVSTYQSTALAQAAEEGAIDVTHTEYPGQRSPWHAAWCTSLAVVSRLIEVLNASSQFVDVEIVSLVQLFGSQLSRALAWSINSSLSVPLLEEIHHTVALFLAIANAADRSFGAPHPPDHPTSFILRAFTVRALHLLQQLADAFLHPNHLSTLVEPVNVFERARQEADEPPPPPTGPTATTVEVIDPAKRPWLASIVQKLLVITSDLAKTLSIANGAHVVLARDVGDWPKDAALLRPTTNVSLNESASIGTAIDLTNYLIDYIRRPPAQPPKSAPFSTRDPSLPPYSADEAHTAARTTLEALVLFTASQMALWLVVSAPPSPDLALDASQRSRRSSVGAGAKVPSSERVRRDISGELSEDFVDLLGKATKAVGGKEGALFGLVKVFVQRAVSK